MSKLSYKIAFPIILSAVFAITIFIALDYEKLRPSFYVVLLFVAVYVFFFGYATGERFASPVQELLERANQLSKGDFSERIYLDTKDEIEELAKIYNKLAEEIEESCAREKNTEKSVDIKVRAKTQALEETINALEQKVRNRTIELEKLTQGSEGFQQQIKNKETEIAKLRQELDSLKLKTQKKETKTINEEDLEN